MSKEKDAVSEDTKGSPPLRPESPPLRPGLTVGAPPPFHQMGEYVFQDLCREVVAEEPTISTCSVYGTRGQKQYGIDLIAHRRANDGIEVVQCKCYAQFPPADIIAASNEFLDHWAAVWSHQSVKRFVLIVACDLIHTQRQDEILRQKQRFLDLGIQYEAWSAHDLQTRLSPHPAIVWRYLKSDHWLQEICGPADTSAHWSAPVGPKVARGVAADLIAALSATVGMEIDHVRGHIREGRYDEAAKWLETGMSPETLVALPPQLRARILRLRASITLELHEDVEFARRLVDEADRLDPEAADGGRLRAVLVLFERGSAAALEALGRPVDVDGLNLRGALLIESGAIQEADAILSRLDQDQRANYETYRLRTFIALSRGDREAAGRFITRAAELAPQRESVRLMQATVHYSGALCRGRGDEVLPWPRPIEWWQVRRDDESRARLDQAHAIVTELLARFTLRGSPRRILETWALACIANHPDRQQEAREFARTTLIEEPGHTRVIAWAVARNMPIPPTCRVALEDMVRAGTAEVHHVLALLNIYIGSDDLADAERLHSSSRALFIGVGAEEVWKRWRVLLLLESGRSEDLRVALSDYEGPLAEDLTMMALGRKERATRAAHELGRDKPPKDVAQPEMLFELCRAAAAGGEWQAIAPWAERLVEAIPTPDAVQLAAVGTFRTRAFERCAVLLQSNTGLFPGSRLPVFLRQMLTRCLLALGRLPAAAREAARLSQERPTPVNLLTVFELHLRQGDLVSCAAVARDLLAVQELTLDQCMLLARVVQVHDRPLATAFWRRAARGAVPDASVGAVVDQGRRLAQAEDAPLLQALHERLTQLGREGRAGIVFIDNEEELLSLVDAQRASSAETARFYRRSEAPLHVLLRRFNMGWARFIQSTAFENESAPTFASRRALFMRHGARPRSIPLEIPSVGERRLNLDITSVLVLDGLGLLERTIAAFRDVCIAQETIPLLVTERTAMQGPGEARLGDLMNRLRALLTSGRLVVLPFGPDEGDEGGEETGSGEEDAPACDEGESEDEALGTFAQASIACLTALLSVTPDRNDVISVDDRFMSRYASNQGVPVVGILELLDALECHGHLTSEEHRRAITRLRAWNVRYLALDEDEVLRHVETATVRNGRLEESRDLRVLRSYVAASLLDAGALQFPPMPPGSPTPAGEIEYVMSIVRAVHRALLALFQPGREHGAQRAHWLLEWLQPTLLIMDHTSGVSRGSRSDPDDLTVLSLAQLVTLPLTDVITVDLADGQPGPQRSEYVRWLDGVLGDYFSAQPALRRRVWEVVRGSISEILSHGEGEGREARLAAMYMARTFMRALPETLGELAVHDGEFLERHGLEVTRTITLDSVCFTNESFHTAVVDAVNGRAARARLAGQGTTSEVEFVVRVVSGTPELVFTPPGATEQATSRDPAFGAISENLEARTRSFEDLRSALNLSTTAFAEIERQLLGASPPARLDHYHDLWNRSGEVFYNAFRQRCARHEEFALREMRPSDAPQTLTYFGLSAHSWDLDRTAQLLLEGRGLEAAIIRMAGVPCALPARLRDAFTALGVEERARLLDRLRRSAQTIMDGVRLLELAGVGELTTHPDHADLGPAVFEFLLSDEGVRQFEAFGAILLWTNSDFLRWADTNDWSRGTRLGAVWMHSHLVLRSYFAADIDPTPFARVIRGATELAPSEIFGQDRLYWRDVAHPRCLEWPTFLASALDMALRVAPLTWWTTYVDQLRLAFTVAGRDDRRTLHPRFMFDTSLCSDHVGSFLAADWSVALRRLLNIEDPTVAAGLSRETLRADRLEAVTALEDNRTAATGWTYLFGMCHDYGFDQGMQARLAEVLATTDLVALASERCGYRIPLAVMQNYVAVLQDRRIAAVLEAQLPSLATALRNANREPSRVRRDRTSLLEAAYVLAAAEPTTLAAVETFVRIANRLCDSDSAYIDAISPLVRRLWRWLPGQALIRLVPLLLRVRRDAGWETAIESPGGDHEDEEDEEDEEENRPDTGDPA